MGTQKASCTLPDDTVHDIKKKCVQLLQLHYFDKYSHYIRIHILGKAMQVLLLINCRL